MQDMMADATLKRVFSEGDIEGLRRTRIPLRQIEFAQGQTDMDPASALLLTDPELMLSSLESLEARILADLVVVAVGREPPSDAGGWQVFNPCIFSIQHLVLASSRLS